MEKTQEEAKVKIGVKIGDKVQFKPEHCYSIGKCFSPPLSKTTLQSLSFTITEVEDVAYRAYADGDKFLITLKEIPAFPFSRVLLYGRIGCFAIDYLTTLGEVIEEF